MSYIQQSRAFWCAWIVENVFQNSARGFVLCRQGNAARVFDAYPLRSEGFESGHVGFGLLHFRHGRYSCSDRTARAEVVGRGAPIDARATYGVLHREDVCPLDTQLYSLPS